MTKAKSRRWLVVLVEQGTWGVVVPALPGCVSAGDDREDAIAHAIEAIEAHCELLTETERARLRHARVRCPARLPAWLREALSDAELVEPVHVLARAP